MIKNSALISLLIVVTIVTGCTSSEYSDHGGMTKYDIRSDAYEYHYKNGFTGVDSLGWDANLQYAWSRAGAALTCDITFDKKLVISQMIKIYGESEVVHELNGIYFHHLQSKKISYFCNADRINEIKSVMPKFENGYFPKYFKGEKKSIENSAAINSVQSQLSSNNPTINGVSIIAVYYDKEETPIGFGKYNAFLFMLQDEQFVIWRNNDSIEYVLSNISTLEPKYPTSQNPIKFTKNNANIDGLKVVKFPKTKYTQAYTFNESYNGSIEGDVIYLNSSSVDIYADGRIEKGNSEISWDFHKIKEYLQK